MDDEDALLVKDPQMGALAAGAGQVVRPDERARPQLVDVQIAVAQAQQLGAQLITAGRRVLLDEALVLERAQNAVCGALGQAQ